MCLRGQDATLAIIGRGQPWVYSFQRNTWAPLPISADAPIGFASPYAQLVYAEKYRVLVNTGVTSKGVAVMRPDVAAAKWE